MRGRDLQKALGAATTYTRWIARKVAALGLKPDVDFARGFSHEGRADRHDTLLTPVAALRIVEATPGGAHGRVRTRLADVLDARPETTGRRADADREDDEVVDFPVVRVQMIEGLRVQVVDLRDLHRCLRVGRQFNTWRPERTSLYDLVEGKDVFRVGNHHNEDAESHNPDAWRAYPDMDKRATPSTRWLVTLTAAKELAMAEPNAIGRKIRRYFIACEERLLALDAAAADAETARLRAEIVAADDRATRLREEVDRAGASRHTTSLEGRRLDLLAQVAAIPAITAQQFERIASLVMAPRTKPKEEAHHPPRGEGAHAPAGDGRGAQGAEADPSPAPGPTPFITSIGIVIDLALRGKDATTADRLAALAHAGCRAVDRRTFLCWRQTREGLSAATGPSPQRGEVVIDGMTLEMRRKAVDAYVAIRRERADETERRDRQETDRRARKRIADGWARAGVTVN